MLAKLTSLQNQINCVPGREQKKANRLGDCYSKEEAWKLMQGASDGYDAPIMAMKKGVESLYLGKMSEASARQRKAMAMQHSIFGYSFPADNVGLVSQSVLYNDQNRIP